MTAVTTSKKRTVLLGLLLVGVAAATSCRRVVAPASVEISVSGFVTDGGEPQANIEVGLFWFGASIPSAPSVFATTDENGFYEISLEAGYCASSRVYAYPDGLVPPWYARMRGDFLTGCGPHVSDIDGWAGEEAG